MRVQHFLPESRLGCCSAGAALSRLRQRRPVLTPPSTPLAGAPLRRTAPVARRGGPPQTQRGGQTAAQSPPCRATQGMGLKPRRQVGKQRQTRDPLQSQSHTASPHSAATALLLPPPTCGAWHGTAQHDHRCCCRRLCALLVHLHQAQQQQAGRQTQQAQYNDRQAGEARPAGSARFPGSTWQAARPPTFAYTLCSTSETGSTWQAARPPTFAYTLCSTSETKRSPMGCPPWVPAAICSRAQAASVWYSGGRPHSCLPAKHKPDKLAGGRAGGRAGRQRCLMAQSK